MCFNLSPIIHFDTVFILYYASSQYYKDFSAFRLSSTAIKTESDNNVCMDYLSYYALKSLHQVIKLSKSMTSNISTQLSIIRTT